MMYNDLIDLSQCLDYRGKHNHPHYATMHAAGLDLSAETEVRQLIPPNGRMLVPTGLWVNLPDNTEVQIRPRSGLSYKHGVTVLNAPGTIDCDYKDEIKVLLVNLSRVDFYLVPGERIAQAVFAPVMRAIQGFTKDTKERVGGFGSTGK
jgi:dUTP pyrophosphatase